MEVRSSNSRLGRSTSNSVIEVLYRDTSTKSSVTTSPERTKLWTQPPSKHHSNKVPVVYYLSRNGQLQHPHFIEVPMPSSSTALYLRGTLHLFYFIPILSLLLVSWFFIFILQMLLAGWMISAESLWLQCTPGLQNGKFIYTNND